MRKLNVAVIGQGRSGKGIHGKYFESELNDKFVVKYVVDACPERRKIAEDTYNCKTFADYTELFGIEDIDIVVNSSYSEMHYPITKDLLEHKFNVLCEKPMGRTRYEAEDLIITAKKNNVILAIFQQSLLAPNFTKVKEFVAKGLIGEPKFISFRNNALARRWDWQTLQKKLAGSVYNTGPHPIGQAMDMMGFGEDIDVAFSHLDCAITSGDANDIAKIILKAPGKPVCDIEINSTDAYCGYAIKVQGTRGTIKATGSKVWVKYFVDSENEERPVIEEFLHNEKFEPMYCKDNLVTHEIEEQITASVFFESTGAVYENLYKVITEGAELFVDPAKIARLVGVMEKVHADNPLPRKF